MQKTATGLGHLVNMLVYENIRETKENMWKTLKHWIENKHGASKIIDTFETYQHPQA